MRTFRPVIRGPVLVALCAVLVASAARAGEKSAGVHDDAKLFKGDVVRQAEGVIREIHDAHARDVLIETYPTLDGIPRGPGKEKEKLRNDFLTEWIIDRGQDLGVRGMMIVVVMDPPHLQIYVGGSTTAFFPRADQEELQRELAQALADKHYDSALTQTAAFIQARMNRHDPRTARPGQVTDAAMKRPALAPAA